MADLKLDEWSWAPFRRGTVGWARELPETSNIKEIAVVLKSFSDNAWRSEAVAGFPVFMFDSGVSYQLAQTAACLKLLNKPYLEVSDSKRFQEVNDLTKKICDRAEPAPFSLRGPESSSLAYEYSGSLCQEAHETLMSLHLIAVWIAFEALAADLWEAALNVRPEGLADLRGTPNRIGKMAGEKARMDDENASESEIKEVAGAGKAILLHDIQTFTRGDYDIRHKMGSPLKGQFKFITLRGTREAYSRAFSEKEKKARTASIDKALADKALDALSLVRNLIVHRAEIADTTYEERAKKYPLAPQLRAGEKLQLNGDALNGLIDPVLMSCVWLIKAVDSWLTLTRPAAPS